MLEVSELLQLGSHTDVQLVAGVRQHALVRGLVQGHQAGGLHGRDGGTSWCALQDADLAEADAVDKLSHLLEHSEVAGHSQGRGVLGPAVTWTNGGQISQVPAHPIPVTQLRHSLDVLGGLSTISHLSISHDLHLLHWDKD